MANAKVVEKLDGSIGVIHPNWNKYTLDPAEAEVTGKQLIEDIDDWFIGEMMKMPDVVGLQPYHIQKMDGQNDFCGCPSEWLADNPSHPLHAVVLAARDAAKARPHVTVDGNTLPDEGSFKGAREFEPVAGIKTNMVKARAIKQDRIRAERNARLGVEDVNYMRADEAGDATGKMAIAARKQALRDLPGMIQSNLDAISDVAALDTYSPAWPE